VRTVLWTTRAQDDLGSIRAFVSQDSPRFAAVIVSRLIAATDRLAPYPESGRTVPEFADPTIREVVHPPYRIVYRLVGLDEVHVLTVHHASQRFPAEI
jgi:plasmid stabilization system protein ParE